VVDGKPEIRLAGYHCRLAGKPDTVDKQYTGLYNARRDNIEKYWRSAFGNNHALLLVRSSVEICADQTARTASFTSSHSQPR
jgi:hypothetical protein